MKEQEPVEDRRGEGRDEDTEAILARRRFLIASALASLGAGVLAAGCSCEPRVCLSVVKPGPATGQDASPKPCLEVAPKAEPCLTPPRPEPKVCLTPLPPK